MIAHDKGKPAVRQGRKAVSLQGDVLAVLHPPEIVWLPKAIGEKPSLDFKHAPRRDSTLAFQSISAPLVGGFSSFHPLVDQFNYPFASQRLSFADPT